MMQQDGGGAAGPGQSDGQPIASPHPGGGQRDEAMEGPPQAGRPSDHETSGSSAGMSADAGAKASGSSSAQAS